MKELDLEKEIKNYYIAISQNQKNNSKNLEIFDINYNGIDEKRFLFSQKSTDDLIWVGRIVPEKGLEKAMEVAIKTKSPLKIVGSIANQDYFKTKIKPTIKGNQNISYLGEDKISFLGSSYRQRELKTAAGKNVLMKGKYYFFFALNTSLDKIDIVKTEFDKYVWADYAQAKKLADSIYQKGKKKITLKALRLLKDRQFIQ